MMESEYFVTPDRAALAVETGAAALTAGQRLGPQDIAVYVGIPFCPTRCAYCSFVSQSVEKSFAMVPPYVDALVQEIEAGGRMVREAGLRSGPSTWRRHPYHADRFPDGPGSLCL